MKEILYNIEWVKTLCKSDLALCHLLCFMRIFRYNFYISVKDSILLEPAEAPQITRIKVKLRTRDNKLFTPPPYYLPDDEAELFRAKLINDFEGHGAKGGASYNKES